MSIPCNLIVLLNHTALPLSTNSPSGFLPWSVFRPPLPHLLGPVDYLDLRAELCTIWLVF